MSIPRIIHQSWKTENHPYPPAWQESWRALHPAWDYRFHSDGDNRELIARHYPGYLPAYDAFPLGIMRADFARFFYLHRWGGVYADLDYIALRPLDLLLPLVDRIGIPSLPDNGHYQVHNALLLSQPGDPFWLVCAVRALRYFHATRRPKVERLAGPFQLQAALAAERPRHTLLPPGLTSPFDWYNFTVWGRPRPEIVALAKRLKPAPLEEIRRHFPCAVALTFWNHGW